MTTKPTINTFSQLGEMVVEKYRRYLPTAFDESMTLLEKVNKVIEYLNTTGSLVDDVVAQWNTVVEWVMNDGLTQDVSDKLDAMANDGTLSSLISTNILGDTTLLKTSDKSSIVSAINEIDTNVGDPSQLQTTDKTSVVNAVNEVATETTQNKDSVDQSLALKVDKNGNEQITMSMLAQDVKNAITGGSVPIVGSDSVNTSNLVQNAVIPQKTSFFDYRFKNLCYLNPSIVTYDNSGGVTSSSFSNGTASFTFTGIDGVWIKLDSLVAGKQYGLFINHNGGWTTFRRYDSTKTTVLQQLTDFANRPKYYVWFTPTESTMYVYLSNNGGSLTPTIDYFKLYQIDVINSITGYYDSTTNTMNENPTFKASLIGKLYSGLTGNAIGDSITAGYTNNNVSYVNYVSSLLGINYINQGVSGEQIGSTIARIGSMQQDVDFITIFEGTNDWNANEPLGSVNDPATNESGTFYGRYRGAIETCLTKWTDKPLILITPLQRNSDGVGNIAGMVNANGWTLSQYVDIIKSLANEYGLPVIDLYSISGMSPYNIAQYTNDGLHPNDIGHKRIAGIIGKEIEKYICVQ